MPFKDPERKKEWNKRWRKESIRNGYGKWLYQQRALRFVDAAEFRLALETVCDVGDKAAVDVAREALKSSEKRWSELPASPAPGQLQDSSPKQPDDTLFEALERLGLSSSRH
jgi:hypothetical protein